MPNRLARETSPYLLQHADNPVDWWPWCDEALALAREQNKPILLSIGYSACHWCHVMAHESFEDPATAALLNRLFVNIKVDREERPDLDHIYQLAHQMLAQRSGGWPLTVFLAPDGTPFFSGTYFPPQPRFGLPGFGELVEQVATVWREQRSELEEQSRVVRDALDKHWAAAPPGRPSERGPVALLSGLLEAYDATHGGFGEAPKFPHPSDLDFLLRRGVSHDEPRARDAALHSLEKMALGGLFDQLGGGFFRYCTDENWQIPHFEKMLYDNGPLLALYADAWLLDSRPLFADVIERTAGWVMREMQAPEGGFYSSLDADSEGHEGRFYTWDGDLLRAALPVEQARLLEAHYGLDGEPNFEGREWHLTVARPIDEVARGKGLGLDKAAGRLEAARKRLFEVRQSRIRPGRDEKVLVSWNGLMIGGLARAGQVMARPEWVEAAQRSVDFIRGSLWQQGRLKACFKDGRARFNAYLDDYAFLLDGLLALLSADYRSQDVEFAQGLAEALLLNFEDEQHGGFAFTSHDHEALLSRPREGRDNALPSGNSVAARALIRLGHLAGDERYIKAGERAVAAHAAEAEARPQGFGSLMVALQESLWPPATAVVRGPQESLQAWKQALAGLYLPHAISVCVPDGASSPPWLERRQEDRVNGWACIGVECMPPAKRPDDFIRILSEMVNAPGIG